MLSFGEVVKKTKGKESAAAVPQHQVIRGRRLLPSLMAAVAVGAFGLLSMPSSAPAAGSNIIEVSLSHGSSINVPIGKSQNVRTDGGFVDILVGDPDTADVMPLTDRSLAILGKKIGTTRVSLYGEGKRLVGVFDVEVGHDTVKLSNELKRRFPHSHIDASSVNGRILLSGLVSDSMTADQAVTIARQFGQEVINSIQVGQSQQVLLEVRFVEVSRTASRELGVNWNFATKGLAISTGNLGLPSAASPFGTLVGNLLKGGMSADVIIKALEERDLARRLAEPNLVALSGDTASFLAGGEFPFPVAANLGVTTIEWKRFGVGLAFTPTVLGNNLINLKIEPEVSQLDTTNVLQVGNGLSVPSLIVRRANTTIELRDGQSFAMAGLLQDIGSTQQSQLPWLSDVPVLGALFRSAQYLKKETDLVIIVTPHLVRPARPGDPIKVPTDATVPANDADLFLMGQSELPRSSLRQMAGVDRPMMGGHILDLQMGASYDAR
jgi:pilus assembly protein CpaC